MDIFKIVPLFKICDGYISLLVTQYSEPFQQVCCDCHGCVAVKLALEEELEEWDAALQTIKSWCCSSAQASSGNQSYLTIFLAAPSTSSCIPPGTIEEAMEQAMAETLE